VEHQEAGKIQVAFDFVTLKIIDLVDNIINKSHDETAL